MKMNEKQFKLLIEITYNNYINKLIIETYNEISLEELKSKSIKKFNIEKKQKNNIIFYYEDEQGDINIINNIEEIYEAAKETNPYIFNIKLKLKIINFKNKNIKNIDVNENIYKNKYLKENEKLKFELEGIKHEKNKEIKMLKNIIKRNEKEYLIKLNRKESKGNMDLNDINEIKNFMKENKGKSFIQLFIEEKQNFINEMNIFKQDIIKKIKEELKNNNSRNKKINNNLVNEDIKQYYNDIINKLDSIIGLSSRKSNNEIINKLDNIIQEISKNQQNLLSLLQKDNEIKNTINKKENRNKEYKNYANKSSDNILKSNKILNNKLQYNSYKNINRLSYLKKNGFIYNNNKEKDVFSLINKTGNNNNDEKEKEEIRIEEEENEDDEEEEEEDEEENIKNNKKPEIKKLEIRKLEYKKPELKTPERHRQEIRKIEIKTPEVKKRWEIKTPERIEGPEIKKRLLKTPDFKGENKDKEEDKMELYQKLKKIEKKEEEEEDDVKEEEETEEEEENDEQIKYSIQLNEKLKDLFFNKNGILKAKPLTIKQLEEIENLYDTLLDKNQNIQEYQDKYINIIKKETNNSNLTEQKKNLIYRQIRIIQELIEKTIKGYKKNDNK
jgi:hypothetical protein